MKETPDRTSPRPIKVIFAPPSAPRPLASTALPLQREGLARGSLFWLIGLLVAAGVFGWAARFNVPAHGGVDQNGYLVGGRNIAATGTMKLAPRDPAGHPDPFAFVSTMWVGFDTGTAAERFYPKYPAGLPAIYAGVIRLQGTEACYWVSPACMALAVLGCFALGQLIGGGFCGALSAIAFGTSAVTLGLSTNPNSHAAAVCCVVWGMYWLMRWWGQGGWLGGWLAGVLIGYAATIRYTEALLALPLVYVVMERAWPGLLPWNWRWLRGGCDPVAAPNFQRRLQALAVIAGWTLPVALLLTYNLKAMGTLTGYANTNESELGSAFRLAYFQVNWLTMLTQLNEIALPLLFPVGVAGLVLLMRWNPRLGLAMGLWIVPPALVYASYYWAPQGDSPVRYMRFFLTILPGLIVCAFAALLRLGNARFAAPVRVAAGLLTLLAAVMGVSMAWPAAQADSAERQALAYNVDALQAAMGRAGATDGHAVIFASDPRTLNQLQFSTHDTLYNTMVINERTLRMMMRPDSAPDEPEPLDPHRRAALREQVEQLLQQRLGRIAAARLTPAQHRREVQRMLGERQRAIVSEAIGRGDGVFVAGSSYVIQRMRDTVDPKQYLVKVVARWRTPAAEIDDEVPGGLRVGRLRPRRLALRSNWQVAQVVRKPPATQPATQPATRPATRPAIEE